MKKGCSKDLKRRLLFKQTEIIQKVLKFIYVYCSIKSLKFLFNKNFSLVSYKTQIKNYCIISGRSRSIVRKFRVSRIFFKVLGGKGFFFGLKKASW
jgi:ribosomal protein S14